MRPFSADRGQVHMTVSLSCVTVAHAGLARSCTSLCAWDPSALWYVRREDVTIVEVLPFAFPPTAAWLILGYSSAVEYHVFIAVFGSVCQVVRAHATLIRRVLAGRDH